MIKNIIFDVGKVLVSYEPEEMMIRMGIGPEDRAAVNAAMYENELWDVSDRGTLEEPELLLRFQAGAPGREDLIKRVYDAVGDTIELLPYTMEWIKDLKERGYGIYILSNYARHTYEQTVDKMRFLALADGAVFSYEYKLMKPEPAMYRTLLDKYGLLAGECVFIDDRPNVRGAEAVGIRGIVFSNYEQARAELNEILENAFQCLQSR